MLCNQLPRDTFAPFRIPRERKREKETKTQKNKQSFKIHADKDRMATKASIHLSYKQEMAKTINGYPNDKTWKGRDILNPFSCLCRNLALIGKSISYYVKEAWQPNDMWKESALSFVLAETTRWPFTTGGPDNTSGHWVPGICSLT